MQLGLFPFEEVPAAQVVAPGCGHWRFLPDSIDGLSKSTNRGNMAAMETTAINPQLLADCHILGRVSSGTLLLSRNAALPWFILVPYTEEKDLLDLPQNHLHSVLADSVAISLFIKRDLAYPKVNFAGLGNVVPQMHLHIIGRREGDACWPQPVWGNLADGGSYAPETLASWQATLVDRLGLETIP
jgi:diadenosine tetraphosphate (Ap4A) HIT family hydrolase